MEEFTEKKNPDVPKGFSSLITGTLIPLLFFLAMVWIGVKFLIPRVDYKELTEVKTAPLSHFKAGINTEWRKDYDFFIVRERQVLFALSAKDKYAENFFHQKAFVNWSPDRNQFFEQNWGSIYDREGNAVGGPSRWPLDRFALRLDETGEVVVDSKNIQNMDGEVKRVNDRYIVEESAREVEPFFITIPESHVTDLHFANKG